MTSHSFDPADAFEALVAWLTRLITRERAPGFVLGISGTDSAVAYLACARAFERLGRPECVRGIHFGPVYPPPDVDRATLERMLTASPSYRWVARTLVPWLNAQVPGARVEVDPDPAILDDPARWAALVRRSLGTNRATDAFQTAGTAWVVGTRNATEQALGAYSNLSGAVSVQPLMGLWKSDVLRLCAWLGVPDVAAAHSRQVDCDCGRYDLAAHHIEELDTVLRVRAGVQPPNDLHAIDHDLRVRLKAFIAEQTDYAGFKTRIPHVPPAP